MKKLFVVLITLALLSACTAVPYKGPISTEKGPVTEQELADPGST